MAKVGGTAYFKINGVQYALRGNLLASLNDRKRESVMGMDQFHGFKETLEACYIECDLTDMPDIDMNALAVLEDATITIELSNGKVGTLRNASQVNKLELNGTDGLFTCRFEGPSGEWDNIATA